MHQFNYEIRKYPITDELLSFIKQNLSELNYTPQEFVSLINENRDLENTNIEEANKLYIDIIDTGNGSWQIRTIIKFDFPPDFIEDILDKKITSINYVNMQGILYNIFILKGYNSIEAHEKASDILDQNQFYTIEKRNKLIRDNIKEKAAKNEDFTYYDVQPTNYDKRYAKLESDITKYLNALRNRDILYTCDHLEEVLKNMKFDLGLIVAVMSSPIYNIKPNHKNDFWNEYQELLSKYILLGKKSDN